MWTLFVSCPNWTAPLRLDGFTSKDWAERTGQSAIEDFRGGYFWAVKLPVVAVTTYTGLEADDANSISAENTGKQAWP